MPHGIGEVARDEREREEQHRAVESGSAQRDVGLREERQRPEHQHDSDEHAVRLELERQVDREHVARIGTKRMTTRMAATTQRQSMRA